ncbi:MAG: hypothetical protein VB027_07610 [Gordonibacter sp.]|nr:hypothetical protein [Gordonibacter sp.]
MSYIKDKVSRLPLPIVPATLGLLVLSGFYETIGYPFVHMTGFFVASLIAIAYSLKIAFHFRGVVAGEYANPMLAALYPTLPMLIMVLCAYIAQLFPAISSGAQIVFFIMLALLFCSPYRFLRAVFPAAFRVENVYA